MTSPPAEVPLLQVWGLSKAYPGVQALSGVDIDVRPGEVHALVGENGAGKSTLIKLLAGAEAPDEGEIAVGGEIVRIRSPIEAQRLGLAFIHQEPHLVPGLSVAENMTLGVPRPRRLGAFVHWPELRRRVAAVCERLRLDVDPETPASRLGVAHQSMVAIGRALLLEAKVLVFDEPTAALTDAEVRRLHEVIGDLRAAGNGIVYVSHRLDEVFALADRVTVLKDGRLVTTVPIEEVGGRDELVPLILGREVEALYGDGEPPTPRREVVLSARDLVWGTRVRSVSFDLHAGEVLGLAGLVGAGRSELARLLFGAERPDAGSIALAGRAVSFRSPRRAIDAGMALLPEERRAQGAVTSMSVRANTTLADLSRFRLSPLLPLVAGRRERRYVEGVVKDLGVRTPSTEQPLALLSGGNQQKVIVGKWLGTGARVLIFDEPTQGIDVGAKAEIYALIRRVAEEGAAVLVISSELEEVVGICSRVLVMREGELVADLDAPDEGTVLAACYGVVPA